MTGTKPLSISLWREPRYTLRLAWAYCARGFCKALQEHPVASGMGGVSAVLVYTDPYMSWVAWWLGLGIVASIGIGTGLQTGVLVVFPIIISETSAYVASSASPSFWEIYTQLLGRILLWGVGTALGEIPPYFFARSLQLEFPGLGLMKRWVTRFGPGAVVALASWPNVTFDACGIACGLVGMPFHQFVGATIVGKAFIKAPIQLAFFILMAGQGSLGFPLCSRMVGWVVSYVPSNALDGVWGRVWGGVWISVVWCVVGLCVRRLVERCAWIEKHRS